MNRIEQEHDEVENGVPRFDGFLSAYDKPLRYRRKMEEWER